MSVWRADTMLHFGDGCDCATWAEPDGLHVAPCCDEHAPRFGQAALDSDVEVFWEPPLPPEVLIAARAARLEGLDGG